MKKNIIFSSKIARVNGDYTLTIKIGPTLAAFIKADAAENMSTRLNYVGQDGARVPSSTASVKFYVTAPRVNQAFGELGLTNDLPARLISNGTANAWPLRLVGANGPDGVTVFLPKDVIYSVDEMTDYERRLKEAVKAIYQKYIRAAVITATLFVEEA